MKYLTNICRFIVSTIKPLIQNLYFGRHMASVPNRSIVFFPCHDSILNCGLIGIVSFKNKKKTAGSVNLSSLKGRIKKIENHGFNECGSKDDSLLKNYIGGDDNIASLLKEVRDLKNDELFYIIIKDLSIHKELDEIAERISVVVANEERNLSEDVGHLRSDTVDVMFRRIDTLKDIAWSLT